MKISLRSTANRLGYEGTNERGQSASFSGNKEGVSPMEHVLMSAAACSAIDVEIFLEKMRAPAERVEVEVTGQRAEGPPAVFTEIHLHYKIFGDVKPSKAQKAVDMSMEQYCSVSMMLKQAAQITWSYEVVAPEGAVA